MTNKILPEVIQQAEDNLQVNPLEVSLDAQKVESRVGAIARAIDGAVKVSIQRTNFQDWMKVASKGGKISYYLQATGAQKVRTIWGIYYRNRQVTKEQGENGTYSYVVEGEVGSSVLDNLYGQPITLQIDGGRSSSDGFFSSNNRTPDPMDVRKSAVSNWEARAICTLLGLKNMTEADLIKNGVDVQKIAGYEFNAGAEGGGQSAGVAGVISDPQAKRLWAICKENNVSDARIKAHIFVKYKYNSSKEIEKKNYDEIVKWVQRGGPVDQNGADEPGSAG